MKVFMYSLFVLTLVACKKETRNEIKLDGEWTVDRIETFYYNNNELVEKIDTTFSGTMILERTSGLYNDASFIDWSPFPYNELNWNASARKLRVITFHTDGTPGASLYNFSFNIEKLGVNNLVLSTHQADEQLNLLEKVRYHFKR